MVHPSQGSTNWEASWPAMVQATSARTLSRGLPVALILGLSALLWELLFGAFRWLIAI